MDACAHFLQLARYNVWATRRLIEAVAVVPEADYRKDMGLFFKSIHGTHHRGQITAALTALDHASPDLDLVYLLQEEAST